jgi:hypothetical protein
LLICVPHVTNYREGDAERRAPGRGLSSASDTTRHSTSTLRVLGRRLTEVYYQQMAELLPGGCSRGKIACPKGLRPRYPVPFLAVEEAIAFR